MTHLRLFHILLTFCICGLIGQQPVCAWTTVGDGVEYQEYSLSGPNKAYVARMLRSNPNVIIDTASSLDSMSGGHEEPTLQAERIDDAINWWGQSYGKRNDVVITVNGDFYNVNGVVTGGQIQTGWYTKRFNNFGGDSGFAFKLSRDVFIGDCINHRSNKQLVSFLGKGTTAQFQGINIPRGSNQLIVYTPQYNRDTLTDNSGVEVVVEMSRPASVIPGPSYASGTIRQIRNGQGATPIPFDHVVLSGVGTAATTLLNNCVVGQQIGISQEITPYELDCNTPAPVDWTNTYSSIGGNHTFLKAGDIDPGTGNAGLTNLNPRTAIAYDSTYVYFVVVDGRSTASIGMSMQDIGEFCRDTLGATHGVNIDGGGSSVMAVNGVVKNVPSDGVERATANSTHIINLKPMETSATAYAPGTLINTTQATSLYLGPGSNYKTLTSLANQAKGEIISHNLNGVKAKGTYWWKAKFGTNEGWVNESQIQTCRVNITIAAPALARTKSGPVVFTLTFYNADSISLTTANVQVVTTGTVAVANKVVSGTGLTTRTIQLSGITGDGTVAIKIGAGVAAGCSPNLETTTGPEVQVDNTPPSTVIVTDEGVWTASTNRLVANWTEANDGAGVGLLYYQYAIGASPATQNIRNWTSIGLVQSITATGFTMTPHNSYYLQVRAVDKVGNIGPGAASDGITQAPTVNTIGQTRLMTTGSPVGLRFKSVTAKMTDAFWIQDTDRSAAIKVIHSSAMDTIVGNQVHVAGTLEMDGNQRVLQADALERLTAGPALGMLFTRLDNLGGEAFNAENPATSAVVGLYSVGLRVTTWGFVVDRGTEGSGSYLYLAPKATAPITQAIKIICNETLPALIGFVTVTGAIDLEEVNGSIVPILRVSSADDIVLDD